MDTQRSAHDPDVGAMSTTELVQELAVHARRLVEVEAARLREEIQRELGRTSTSLREDAAHAFGEARARLDTSLVALKADVSEQLGRVASAAKPGGIGAALVHAALFLVLAAVTLGLGHALPLWLSALIVGVAAGATGAVLLKTAGERAQELGKHPLSRTEQNLKENKRWIIETKETISRRLHAGMAALRGIELPKLHRSSSGELGPST